MIEFAEAGGIARSLLDWRKLGEDAEFSEIERDSLRSPLPAAEIPSVGIADS